MGSKRNREFSLKKANMTAWKRERIRILREDGKVQEGSAQDPAPTNQDQDRHETEITTIAKEKVIKIHIAGTETDTVTVTVDIGIARAVTTSRPIGVSESLRADFCQFATIISTFFTDTIIHEK